MKIDRNNIDALNTQISVTVEQSDYSPKFNAELEKLKKKAQLKGFRKGKTPTAVVKKMYGQSIIADAVNESLQKGLFDYIEENKINILGDPIPAEDEKMVDFDPNNLQDYTFKFDMGLSPEFELKGASKSDSYLQYEVEVDDKIIEDEILVARKRFGTQKPIADNIEEKDIITINAFELDEKGKRKKEGHETSFTIMVDLMNEDVMRETLTKKKGDKIDFDIWTIERDRPEDHVKKYILKFAEGEEKEVNNHFEGFIDEVSRTVEADMNQEFFDKYLGEGKVTDEAGAKETVKGDLQKYFGQQTKSLMYREILEKLTEVNDIPLPEAFLKRWLKLSNAEATMEQIESEFDAFKKNLQWTLIKGDLAKKYEIKVEPEEIKEKIGAQVVGYMAQYGLSGEYVDNMINKLMQDRNQVNKVYEEILADKVFGALENDISTTTQKVSIDEFKDIVAAINQKMGN